MSQMLSSIEKLPEAASLLMLGGALLIVGVVVRKTLRVYERIVARKDVSQFKATRAEARF